MLYLILISAEFSLKHSDNRGYLLHTKHEHHYKIHKYADKDKYHNMDDLHITPLAIRLFTADTTISPPRIVPSFL